MDFVEQLKSSIDIVKVVGEYVRLRRIGSTGRYLGLCPFHQEKTPSFNVNQTRQFYKCFGCGVGGDALKFVMEVDGLTFPETLKLLAERNGIPMPKRTEYADADSKLRGALYDMHAIAVELYRTALAGPQGGEARSYLDRRGVTAELIGVFELGFSDPAGQALVRRLSDQGFTPEQMEASGLVRRRTEGSTYGSGFYDAFRGRLMFPIHNESGKVIAFGGRALGEDQPKYLNSPETPIYKKTSTLYNLHRARDGMRKSNRVVLVEGYMDVIGVYAAGVREVVASCGTALTNPQVRAMHRHADTVVVNFDPDTAGANAAERAIQLLLDENLHVHVVSLEGGLDPDEYVKQRGAEAYRAKLDSASGYFHWLADRARGKFDMRSAEGRMDAFKFLLPSVQKISDNLERAAVASDIAGYLGVEPGLVLDQFRKAAATRSSPGSAAPSADIPGREVLLLNALIASPQARSQVLPNLSSEMIADFATRDIFKVLQAMEASGVEIGFSGLEARLEGSNLDLLHRVLAADKVSDDSMYVQQAVLSLRELQRAVVGKSVKELRTRIQAAERDGRMEEVFALAEELSRVQAQRSQA